MKENAAVENAVQPAGGRPKDIQQQAAKSNMRRDRITARLKNPEPGDDDMYLAMRHVLTHRVGEDATWLQDMCRKWAKLRPREFIMKYAALEEAARLAGARPADLTPPEEEENSLAKRLLDDMNGEAKP